MKLNTIYKFALGTLAGLVLAAGIVYTTKPGKCPNINDYRLDRTYSVGVVYGAWLERVDSAVMDYHGGNISYLMPTGNKWEIDSMKKHAIESGIPEDRIIEPVSPSRNTMENITSIVNTVRQRGLPTDIRHYSSDEHLPRIRMIVRKLNGDPENDDGYVPVSDGYDNKLYFMPNRREWAGCVKDRVRIILHNFGIGRALKLLVDN